MTIPVCIPSADSGFVQLCSAGSGWNSDPTAHLAASSGSMFSQPSVSGKTSSFTVFWRENEDCSFNFKKTNTFFYFMWTNLTWLALPNKAAMAPSAASWAALTPAASEELHAIRRSCSPWVSINAEPTFPAPRSTCRTSASITAVGDVMSTEKWQRWTNRNQASSRGIKCCSKGNMFGFHLGLNRARPMFNLGDDCHLVCY